MGDIFKQTEQLDLFGNTEQESVELSLFDRFIIPPFSIFDSRQGYWQSRKKTWLSLGIKSEIGRDSKCFHMQEWADKKWLEYSKDFYYHCLDFLKSKSLVERGTKTKTYKETYIAFIGEDLYQESILKKETEI